MTDETEARAFTMAFRSFLEWVHDDARTNSRNEISALVVDFLGPARARRSVVSRSLAVFEHVNLGERNVRTYVVSRPLPDVHTRAQDVGAGRVQPA